MQILYFYHYIFNLLYYNPCSSTITSYKEVSKELEKAKKKKKAKTIFLFILKIIFILVIVSAIVFSLNKWIIPLIKGDNKWITLGGLILSIVGGIGVIFAIINKCLIKPFKNKLEKIDNSTNN